MKKILFILALLISTIAGFSQAPIGCPQCKTTVRGILTVDSLFLIPFRNDTLINPGRGGGIVFAYGQAWLYTGAFWSPLTGVRWGNIPGNITLQTDLMSLFNAKQNQVSPGYGWKFNGAVGSFDSAVVRKLDTLYKINDSTAGFAINGHVYTIVLNGKGGGTTVTTISLALPTILFNSPANFTNVSGAWTATASLVNQSAGFFFGGPISGTPGPPSMRQLAISDLPTGIPNTNLATPLINLGTPGTSGTVPNWSSTSVGLGGSANINIPIVNTTNTGIATPTLFNFWSGKVDSTVQSGDSVYEWRNGTRFFRYVVIGGGGGSGLNQLTNDVIAGPGSGSQSATVTGIQNHAISLATGNLRYSGTAWGFDNTNYTKNTGGAAGIGVGVFSAKPAAGNPGALYFATDSNRMFRDNGTIWVHATDKPDQVFNIYAKKDGGRGIQALRFADSSAYMKGLVDSGAFHWFLNPDSTITGFVSSSGGTGITNITVSRGPLGSFINSSNGTGDSLRIGNATNSGLIDTGMYTRLTHQLVIVNNHSAGADTIASANADTLKFKPIIFTSTDGSHAFTDNTDATKISIDLKAGTWPLANVSGILAGANGGTGNGFFAVSGPASTLKTFTFPNASATVLTTNSTVTVAQGGTGAASLTGILKGNGTSAFSTATAGTDYSVGTSALITGILKSTTSTGNLSIATAIDFPTLNQNTTGTAANVTGTVAVANGGSGANTLSGILKGNGTSPFTAAIVSDFPTLNQNTTGTASNLSGTPTLPNGTTATTQTTGDNTTKLATDAFVTASVVNIYNGNGTLTTDRVISGGGNNLTFGVPMSPLASFNVQGGSISLSSSGASGITLNGPINLLAIATAGSTSDYSSVTDNYIELPTPTANHTVTLPTASFNVGRIITIINKNTSGSFSWSFVTTVTDPSGNTITAIPNGVSYTVISDGASWILQGSSFAPAATSSATFNSINTVTNTNYQVTTTDYYVLIPSANSTTITVTLANSPVNGRTLVIFNRSSHVQNVASGTGGASVTDASASFPTSIPANTSWTLGYNSTSNLWFIVAKG